MRIVANKNPAWNKIGIYWDAIPEWHLPLGEGQYKIAGGATPEEAKENFYKQNDHESTT